MKHDDAWRTERSFWLEGIEQFESGLAQHCVMAFPEPVGILVGDDILHGLAGAPRWNSLDITHQVLTRPDDDSCVLGYRADARRDAGDAYAAFCTSTYRRTGAGWKLVQHQQTPIG
ncbi:hypothetical protein EDC65_4686 [Stella humosa]|uniref:SnoaL-like protein n=1 Tax=Stella humosa TaxID=94 RepID=A0A3N1L0W7_9PROT|nr:hypothetical protein [Stella humosa]ROP83155.1 hypothetical protein EDC65_4686 [Stella humosa]BBK30068.1 hypothetical protein STHU_07020 [Stella humosa]